MKKDYRPYAIVRIHYLFSKCITHFFLKPQFEKVGVGLEVWRPWNVEVFGGFVSLGQHIHILADKYHRTQFCAWKSAQQQGEIQIGDYVLISPGVRIQSASSVSIGDNTMIASNVYISDADWHGIYDRVASPGKTAAICIGQNCWIGEGAKIGKGVSIGDNSIVSMGAVVVKDVPANVIVGGNPANIIQALDTQKNFTKRQHLFHYFDEAVIQKQWQTLHKIKHSQSRWSKWIQTLLLPQKGD